MPRRPFLALALVLGLAPAAMAAPNLGGRYDSNPNRYPAVSLTLHQEGVHATGSLTIVGDARAMRVVIVPVEGDVKHGQLAFPWEDNFGNAGTATFKADGKAYLVRSKMTRRTNDGRYFEGDFRLTKTGPDPGS